jgi:adenylate cyclase
MRVGDRAAAANGVGREIAREELAGLAYVFWGRLIALAVLATWAALTVPFERSGLYIAIIGIFAALGAGPYLLARRGVAGPWAAAAFLLIDAAAITYVLVTPPSFYAEGWTPQLNLRLQNVLYLGVFLVGMALSYSPALVIWTGIASVVAWSAGFFWVASLPDSIVLSARDSFESGLSGDAVIRQFLDPSTVSLTAWSNQVIFLVLVTLILSLAVWRSRRLVRRQAAVEAERAALSRYFSPNIVEELAASGGDIDRTSVQPAAVLFADMVGFTAISERLPPDELVALLREFHGRLAQVAFAHDGTVDKYIGDAIMVHFGTPRPKDDDPVRALACAGAMIDEIGRWNAKRAKTGEVAIGIGIGVHYGEVLVGNIGDARRLEYAVLGDTVNVASRLERLTREIRSQLVVSDDLVRAVRTCGVEPDMLIEGLHADQAQSVRGRRKPVGIWRIRMSG